ncbi:flagellar export chaperone FliS [Larsenimonas rhizosphaerae]|uniref:Flagellar secretion chaperone FliS n=1 Tax=Larsenimonas rhizosphaerae TaxID=2944682 RepID=A0AA42CT24_9GAMM|nr:flagellar export chaperone FliS [Larsenimonas rhizosphaerae]MCM2130472.1 flagellar export chaperone FliS [Larsenimonas rhizosphaerae]MCX2523177.1 flagellar export chaperone FliS [Larsenimonas rhizosphaerae]
MLARTRASAYADIGLETGVMSATPHQLIVMLFDGAQAALMKATWAIDNKDIALKGTSLSKAIRIIEEGLRASLDKEQGGPLAEQLDSLYDYMSRELTKANVRNDADAIRRVSALLSDISGAWKEIGQTVDGAVYS